MNKHKIYSAFVKVLADTITPEGAIGYFRFDGSVNHAIVIRSILSKNNTLTYQAGAGIVVGSTPQGERKEIDNKVAAIRRAIISAVEI